MKVVTFGEIMLRLSTPDYLKISQANDFEISFAGAEANVAVSAANYGLEVDFVTALPNNPIAEKCISELRGFKVGVDNILIKEGRMGILFIEKGAIYRPSKVFYDRDGSCINLIQKNEFNWDKIFENANWFHWTGITPSLSANSAEILTEAVNKAVERGLTISCDLNFRSKLWKYTNDYGTIMKQLVSYSDIILGNEEDCYKYFHIKPETQQGIDLNNADCHINSEDYISVCKQMHCLFPKSKKIIITVREALNSNHNMWSGVLYDGQDSYISNKYNLTHIVDRVGGGDSFMGALIYAINQYEGDNQKIIDFAAAASALKHTISGDYNRVSVEDVESLMSGNANGRVVR